MDEAEERRIMAIWIKFAFAHSMPNNYVKWQDSSQTEIEQAFGLNPRQREPRRNGTG